MKFDNFEIFRSSYKNGNGLYFCLYKDGEPWCDITTNLSGVTVGDVIALNNDFVQFSSEDTVRKVIQALDCNYIGCCPSGFSMFNLYTVGIDPETIPLL